VRFNNNQEWEEILHIHRNSLESLTRSPSPTPHPHSMPDIWQLSLSWRPTVWIHTWISVRGLFLFLPSV
jgi:hypothetical protein